MGQTGGTLARSKPPQQWSRRSFSLRRSQPDLGRASLRGARLGARPCLPRPLLGPGRDPRGARGNGGRACLRGRALDQICMLGARVSILVFKATLGRALAPPTSELLAACLPALARLACPPHLRCKSTKTLVHTALVTTVET